MGEGDQSSPLELGPIPTIDHHLRIETLLVSWEEPQLPETQLWIINGVAVKNAIFILGLGD